MKQAAGFLGRIGATLAAATLLIVATAAVAMAQVSVDPSVPATKNTGEWTWGMAWLLTALSAVAVVGIFFTYLRYASRFSSDEENLSVVRADRVLPGKEPPRRSVDLSQAAPVVVAPPVPAGVAAAAAPAPAAAAPAAAAPAPAAAAPAPAAAPAAAAPAPAATPAAEPADAPADAPAAAPAAPAPAAEHVEVTMDQAVYEQTLKEMIDQGTDRRIAEGRAKRAGMIAARRKAEGG